MKARVVTVWIPAFGLFLASGCESHDVGAPCVPEEEYEPSFSGFAVEEVNTESRSFQCATRLCLVNHFQGRVSCPYGQGDPAAAADRRCFVPGSQTQIRTAVAPQLLSRRAEDAVYCSCRCDGPDPNARYCECPSGYACTELVPEFELGQRELTGKYCVREGTLYDLVVPPDECDPRAANCD